jgi:hypothetical protein
MKITFPSHNQQLAPIFGVKQPGTAISARRCFR